MVASQTLPLEVLKKYTNDIFVETGTNEGKGVSLALLAGFKEVFTIEIKKNLVLEAKKKFATHNNVHIYHGSSGEMLPTILSKIDKPTTFWLDAHDKYEQDKNPLFQELEAIKKHHINTHTIMIDDKRGWKQHWNIDEDKVISMLMKINQKYTIKYEKNTIKDDDILVAYCEELI